MVFLGNVWASLGDLRDRFRTAFQRAGADDAFDEQYYLDAYPDVAAAVQMGMFTSGREHYLRHGRAQGRRASGVFNARSRDRAVFHLIDRGGQGLEIGASINPLAPKKRGYKVHILDHASADDLRAKYEAIGQPTSEIEEVDFVLGLTHLGLKAEFPTRGCEFYVSLGHGTASSNELTDRLGALKGIVAS
ncbi:MAG: Ubiquinone biosynthesis O-methyltransferase [Pseudomonadota bacterium]|jgi:hypothetical protein